MKLSTAIEGFFIYLQADGYSDSTVAMYDWALSRMVMKIGDIDVDQVSEADMMEFWSWLRTDYQPTRKNKDQGPLSGRSLENIWTAHRSFFGWCFETRKLKKRPDIHIKRPEYAEREIMPLTDVFNIVISLGIYYFQFQYSLLYCGGLVLPLPIFHEPFSFTTDIHP